MGPDRRSRPGAQQGGPARLLALALVLGPLAVGAGCRRQRADGPPPVAPVGALPAVASPPPATVPRGPTRPTIALGFARAKKVALRDVYGDRRVEAYCACTFDDAGAVEPRACGYVPRKEGARARRIEWEHVVPARRLGEGLACWRGETEGCRASKKRGRDCCSRSVERGGDALFHAMEGDLHNLVPAVGELNGDRSDRPHGVVDREPRDYGACDFEIDRASGRTGAAEPPDPVRGDVARIWLYAVDVWGVPLGAEEAATFRAWSADDPVDAWELERDRRIERAQGNRNHHVAR